MTINQVRRAAQLLEGGWYAEMLDDEGVLREDEPFSWTAKPWQSMNDLRKAYIERKINGKKIVSDDLSAWAKSEMATWDRDVEELLALGVTPETVD